MGWEEPGQRLPLAPNPPMAQGVHFLSLSLYVTLALLTFFLSCVVLFASVSLLLWLQLTTNIIPGSNKVIRPNSGPCRARPSAALTAVSFLMLKLAL